MSRYFYWNTPYLYNPSFDYRPVPYPQPVHPVPGAGVPLPAHPTPGVGAGVPLPQPVPGGLTTTPIPLVIVGGFSLTISKVEPSVPLEYRPMQVFFSLKNNSQVTSSGRLGPFQVRNLAPGATIGGSTTVLAPSAGKGKKISISYIENNAPMVGSGEFAYPRPSATADFNVDVTARYILSLDNITIRKTRALHNDTDYIAFNAKVGDQPPLQLPVKFMGDLNDGTYPVNLRFDHLDIMPGGTQDLTFNYIVTNKGHSGDIQKFINEVGQAGAAALEKSYPTGGIPIWPTVIKFLTNLVYPDCDGVVASDAFTFTSTDLYNFTNNSTKRFTRSIHSTIKFDDPFGSTCHSDPDYTVTWTIIREVPY